VCTADTIQPAAAWGPAAAAEAHDSNSLRPARAALLVVTVDTLGKVSIKDSTWLVVISFGK